MKKIALFVCATLISGASMAQSPVQEGNFLIDVYAGIPNWANSIAYSKYDADNAGGSHDVVSNYKVNGGMLSYGGRFEYMLADDFGFGADVNYEESGFQFDYLDTVAGTPYHYDYTATKIRVMARMNKHFVQNDRVDAYFGVGAGYKWVNRNAYSLNKTTNVRTDEEGPKALVPVAFRLAIGTRVYFTQNIGMHVELGAFGGALLQFGLSAKF